MGVFAVDFMLYLLVLGFSSWLGGLVLDEFHVPPRMLMAACAVLSCGSGLVWWWLRRGRGDDPVQTPRGVR